MSPTPPFGRQNFSTRWRNNFIHLIRSPPLCCKICRCPRSSRIIVWIFVYCRLLFIQRQLIANLLELFFILCIQENEIMCITHNRPHIGRCSLLPNNRRNKVLPSKDFIAHDFHVRLFIIVYGNPDGAILPKELAEEFEARVHYVEPGGVFEVIVIVLERRACIIRRIDVDAFHAPRIKRKQCLQRLQIVAMHKNVVRVAFTAGSLGV